MTEDPLTDAEKTLIWNAYAEMGVYERHLNGLQQQYRMLASTWLLAMFGAVGLALKQTSGFAISPEILVCAVGLAGAIGITLLWSLDLRVYHQLLNACLTQGLILEDRHKWLPQMRHMMVRARNLSTGTARNGFSQRVVWFYVLAVLAGLGVATLGAVASFHSGAAQLTVLLCGILVAFLWGWLMIAGTNSPILHVALDDKLRSQDEDSV